MAKARKSKPRGEVLWRTGWSMSEPTRRRFVEAFGKARARSNSQFSMSEFAERILGMGLDSLDNLPKDAW